MANFDGESHQRKLNCYLYWILTLS